MVTAKAVNNSPHNGSLKSAKRDENNEKSKEEEALPLNGKDAELGAESPPPQEREDERDKWTGKLDFVMSAISFAVGMGNIWRFPYMCYRNGGGAFLIPYIIMVAFAGFPLMFLELSFGQFGSLGVVSIWRASPLFQGIGWTMFFISFISCIYYNMLIAYSFFYMVASFAKDVPWRDCGNWWNTPGCGGISSILAMKNCTSGGGVWTSGQCISGNNSEISGNVTEIGTSLAFGAFNGSDLLNGSKARTPADEFFHFFMLDISDGIEDLGPIRWQLAIALLFCWIIVAVCLSKGIKSSGKVTYITALCPYLILIILLVRSLLLDGSTEGILYFLTPKWQELASAKVWADAAIQVFFSMSTCWGGLITLASYNKFHNNCLRDAIVVSVGDFLTSLFGGIVIFAIIGFMAHDIGVPIDQVATQGAGLAYIVYPSAVTKLPISPLWSILFMLMLVNLGIGTQFTLVTTSHTTIVDQYHTVLRKGRRPLILLVVMCAFCYLCGLVITTRGGMYVLQLMDSYAPSYGLLIAGLAETLVISWVYGLDRYFKNIEQMLGKKPSVFWVACWRFITPALIVFILLFTIIDFKPSTYGDYKYPTYAEIVGLMLLLIEVGCIPGVAIYKIITCEKKLPIWQRIKYLARPAENWGPAEEIAMKKYAEETMYPLNRIPTNDNDIIVDKPQVA